MKRALAVAGTAVLAMAAAVCVHLWSLTTDRTDTSEDARPQRAARAPRPSGLADVAVSSSGGTLAIRGRVKGPGGPIPGAVVAAFTAAPEEAEDPLLRQICHTHDGDGDPLGHCEDDEASTAFAEAFAARQLERPALARAVTDAEGRFSLEGLAPGAYDVWAEREGGFASQLGQDAPADGVDLELEAGVLLRGKVEVDGVPPASTLLVSGLAVGFPRIFEAATGAGGAFTLGPLPATAHVVTSTTLEGYLGADRVVEVQQERDLSEVEMVLSSPRRVTGVVLDDGRPVPGVELELLGGPEKLAAVSDASGRFAFERVHPADYEVHGTAPFAAGTVPVSVPEDRDPEPVTLDLDPVGRLRGVVLDETGRPLKGALVFLAGHETMTTEENGRFELTRADGKERLIARANGYLLYEEELEVPPRTTLERNVVLRPAILLKGTVVDDTGQPVRAASVSLLPASGPESEESSTSTEEDGAFEMEASRSSGEVEVESRGYVPTRQAISASAPARIVLKHGATLTVRLVDTDGRPVTDAAVIASLLRGPDRRPFMARKESGEWQLAGLGAGEYRVEAHCELATEVRVVRVDGHSPGRLEMKLPATGEISGTVVSSIGAPVADAWVRAAEAVADGEVRYGNSTHTDEQGQFHLQAGRGGRYTLLAMKDNHPPADGIPATVDGAPVKIVLRDTASVRGRILYPDGAPARTFSIDGERERSSNGTFEREVTPGEQNLSITAPGFAPQVKSLNVREGESLDLGDVPLAEGRAVAIRVVDARSGAPVKGAQVHVAGLGVQGGPDEGTTVDQPSRRTRSDGSTELMHVPDGAFVEAEADGYQTSHQAIGPGGSAIIRLEPNGALRVVLDDPFDGPLWVSVEGPSDQMLPLDPTAGAIFRALPPGEYLVSAWSSPPEPGAGRWSGKLAPVQPVNVTLAAEGDGEVHLRLRSTGTDVTIRLSGGAPEWDANLFLLPPGVDLASLNLDSLRAHLDRMVLPERPMNRSGPAQFRRIPDGTYRVVAMVFGFNWRSFYVDPRPLVLPGGGARELQVTIPDDWRPERTE
ncbi:MAG TPA: carboxypeptidase regulatory-like domain-containing protein [Myxococcales bacterium]|jgi:protocatechuate 3,4-dioxygenase beta subunit|nr:carboxypeptidase regulatory-like domain-containing protein [Myxococcales bacterium]